MTLRGIDWAVLLGASGCGAAILLGCLAFTGDTPPFGYLRLALVALVAASAFILDEPAAAAVDATPTPLTRRTAIRTTALAAPVTIWILGVLAVEQRTPSTPALALLVEGTGVIAVAVALAASLRRVGNDEPGDVIASVCGAAILAILLLNPLLLTVPVFPVAEGWVASSALWASLTLVSVVVTISVSREPRRRRDAHNAPGRGLSAGPA